MTESLGISIRQPWAELILRGQKTAEIRSWETSYRGPLWLHTGKIVDAYALVERQIRDPSMENLFTGGFVGWVFLESVIALDHASWESMRPQHLNAGPLRPGSFAFVLGDARRFEQPLPASGALGLFNISSDTRDELERRLGPPSRA